MTNSEKSSLRWHVCKCIADAKNDSEIIDKLEKLGFQKQTIKKYIKALK